MSLLEGQLCQLDWRQRLREGSSDLLPSSHAVGCCLRPLTSLFYYIFHLDALGNVEGCPTDHRNLPIRAGDREFGDQ